MNVCKIVPQSFPPVYSNPNRYFSAHKESSHKQLKPHSIIPSYSLPCGSLALGQKGSSESKSSDRALRKDKGRVLKYKADIPANFVSQYMT